MATTGFWPVKCKLRDVIKYAENPDKTTDKRYLDEDLQKVLAYAENSEKTDRTMYVSAINCPKQRAYECMIETKKRFGKLGGNVAYHGYQSFAEGEVTPEEAHQIGVLTAKRMWGSDYEIMVTTHLNTDNIHNHIVVNSVSFRTGRKFKNHISDHYKLREISDEICRERNKSVLKESKFTGSRKRDYWVHKNGGLTHRDVLRNDIDEAIKNTNSWVSFDYYLKNLGYHYVRTRDYAHPSIIAPGWKKPIRIDSLGEQYSMDKIKERLIRNQSNPSLYVLRIPKRYTPLNDIETETRKLHRMDSMQIAFALLTELLKLATGNNIEQSPVKPLSPAMRQEVRKLDKTLKEYKFLCDNGIDRPEELISFIREKSSTISEFEHERSILYNRCRRPKNDEEKEKSKAAARGISAKIKPLRSELKMATDIAERYPKILELLETERQMEREVKNKQQQKGR